MDFNRFDPEQYFHSIWNAVRIARRVEYGLFTFGTSDLPYYLVVDSKEPGEPVDVSRGEVKITRPMVVTPYNARPEFANFFEEGEFDGMVDFLLARTAAFSHLRLERNEGPAKLVSDSVEEVVAKLNRQLDDEDEDRVAILTAPHGMGRFAVLKYAIKRIMDSAPGNIQELRDRGFLPEE
ncbi:MAG: hypothetical protein KDA88_06010 [Planctomycetaceae bacterium]|nr:hypothetical protein [Planctomycetaceae bacterium]MCB9950580.1 hypothetical protein [Planctomycetaceae bacterium]